MSLFGLRKGTIKGTVSKSGGVPAASIKVLLTKGASTVTTTTGPDGKYTAQVAAGTYIVKVTLPGYQPFLKAGVIVAAGATVTVDVLLLAALGTIMGTVKDSATQQPIAGVTVEIV